MIFFKATLKAEKKALKINLTIVKSKKRLLFCWQLCDVGVPELEEAVSAVGGVLLWKKQEG